MKPLEERVNQLVSELGLKSDKFPTYSQLRVILTAEGYLPWEVDRWFTRYKEDISHRK